MKVVTSDFPNNKASLPTVRDGNVFRNMCQFSVHMGWDVCVWSIEVYMVFSLILEKLEYIWKTWKYAIFEKIDKFRGKFMSNLEKLGGY